MGLVIYWQKNGGLAIPGFTISSLILRISQLAVGSNNHMPRQFHCKISHFRPDLQERNFISHSNEQISHSSLTNELNYLLD